MLFLTFTLTVKGQYSFEKFPAVKYRSYDWKIAESESHVKHSLLLPEFFSNGKSLSIKLTYFLDQPKDSEIHFGESEKKYYEDIPFTPIGLDSLRVADFNGDGLNDLKISSYYMGNGLASLNIRIIYFFQKKDNQFVQISFDDKMGDNRSERDFDNDGNFEIITMTLQGHKDHNYWLFNIYNFQEDKLVNVNSKASYPIMVQFLHRETFEITKNLTRREMKKYEMVLPRDYTNK